MWSLQKASSLILLAALAMTTAVAQTVTSGDEMFLRMREVGGKLRCQCGCAYTVADCNMLNCSFRELANPEIRKALTAGVAPDAVVEQMIAKFGPELRTEPLPEGFGLFGWAMPFVALVLGCLMVPFVVRHWKQKERLAEQDRPPLNERVVAEYEAAIERDLAESD